MGETPSTSATSEANSNTPCLQSDLVPFGYQLKHLFSQFTLVSIQETKFSSSDAVCRVTHFSKVCDSKSISFWSHPTTTEFSDTRGRDGVGLLLSGKHPFQTVADVTHQYVTFSSSTLLSYLYLVIQARADDINLYVHVVYAPVQVADQKDFFNELPTRFPDDCHHLVMGDFDVPMDPILDEVKAYMHDIGRAEFIAWQLRLGITDAWRNWWSDKREFTGPGRKNCGGVKLEIGYICIDSLTTTIVSSLPTYGGVPRGPPFEIWSDRPLLADDRSSSRDTWSDSLKTISPCVSIGVG
ncbi:hypothetical protein PsorP6_005813 [Peronosclerospora sorghi]|uniref:Uncharacterized protein n=1 Tax=Peronosclerospora sorghi TaxID=230839 RepID=A0ACC0W629_9STRA|nr:hypothetical protein PsorP6_005813 [Peronosclerospora sorghi]